MNYYSIINSEYLLLLFGMTKQINQWCQEAGGDIELRYIIKNPKAAITATDASNPFWMAFKSAVDEL